MRILSITAQKPHSTGSGVYLTELVKNWNAAGHEQAVLAGVYEEDMVQFPEEVAFYPVQYLSETLPFAIAGMSDEMPYESTRYQDFTEEMLKAYQNAFGRAIEKAVEQFNPDLIVCHHLYLLTALVREWYPKRTVIGICHGSDLRQICKNPLQREYIQKWIPQLNGIVALHEEQKQEIVRIFDCREEFVHTVGVGYNQTIFCRKKTEKRDNKQLAFAGKVTEKKGIFSLLRALEMLDFASDELVIKIAGGHGSETEYEAICKLAETCKFSVTFLGVLQQEALAEVFRQSDVFVLPSFFEGLPLVTMEAMACGCKVVCSEIPGMEEWLCEHVPGQQVEFIPLPKMSCVDEPKEEELPMFEKRLAEALQKKLEQREEEHPDLSGVSWEGISRRVLEIVNGKEGKICL